MDGLSVAASVIAVLQVANAIISVCYDFRSVLKDAPWGLTKVTDQLKDLRNVLETLEMLAEKAEKTDIRSSDKLPAFRLLCDPENGPLDMCLRELNSLEKKLAPSSWSGKVGSKRQALIRTIGWQLKDSDIDRSLQRIERCKATLNLAITADEATLLLDIQEMSSSINRTVLDIQESFSTMLEEVHLTKLDERQKQIIQWLSTLNPEETHTSIVRAHKQGTSDWIIHSDEFISWYAAERSFLWLSGFPGAGKTTLFSAVVEYLRTNVHSLYEKFYFAYFYCDFRRHESQDPVNILGSLVAQLCSQIDHPEALQLAFDQSLKGSGQQKRVDLVALKQALQSFAKDEKIVLLVDALDECEKREELLRFLNGVQNEGVNLNILITSRDEADIREAFPQIPRIRIEKHPFEVAKDINRYIESRLEDERRLGWLKPAVKQDIQRSLASRAQGMFRWVQCQLDIISTLKTIKGIRKALEELPHGLNETYESILLKVPPGDTEIVRRILLWLAFTVLPMTLAEIQEAIAIEHDLTYLDEEARLSSPQDILDLCGSLVAVSDTGEAVLAHHSVKDYLLSPYIRSSPVSSFSLSPPEACSDLAVSCLTYFSFRDFSTGPSRQRKHYKERLEQFPLLSHAATAWPYYACEAGQPTSLNERILSFFSPASRPNFMAWVQVLNANPRLGHTRALSTWDVYPRHATSRYYAASFGLDATVHSLIASGANVNAPGSRFGGTAFHAAVLREHVGVMDILVQAGADPNQADWQGISPMYSATSYDNVGLVEWLLMHGAEPLGADFTATLFGGGVSEKPSKIPVSKEGKGRKPLPLPADDAQSALPASRDDDMILSPLRSDPVALVPLGVSMVAGISGHNREQSR